LQRNTSGIAATVLEQWRRVEQRATATGGASAGKAAGRNWLLLLLFPSATVTCKIKQKHNIGSRF